MTLFNHEGPKILLYADDTVIYFSHTDINLLFHELNSGLDKIWEWCKFNRLSINTAKTKYMVSDPYKRVDVSHALKLGGGGKP